MLIFYVFVPLNLFQIVFDYFVVNLDGFLRLPCHVMSFPHFADDKGNSFVHAIYTPDFIILA